MEKTEIVPVEGRKMLDAALKVTFEDGGETETEVPLSFGHPGNPMGWNDLAEKFHRSVVPELGAGSEALFNALKGFETPGSLQRLWQLTAPSE